METTNSENIHSLNDVMIKSKILAVFRNENLIMHYLIFLQQFA